MNCQQADKYIYEYCDARLSPELMREFEEHLANCEVCTDLVILTRFENEALHEFMAFDLNVAENFTARVMSSLPAATAPTLTDIQIIKPSRSWRPVVYFAAAAAATVLLFTAAVPGWFDQLYHVQNKNVAVHDNIQREPRENASFMTGKMADNDSTLESAGAITTEKEQAKKDSAVINDSGNSPEVMLADTAYGNFKNSTLPVQIAMADQAAPNISATETQRGISSTAAKTAPKASAVPDRYRSYTVNLAKPIEEVPLVPDNLPGNYVLTSDSSDVFVYTDANTDKTIQIFIKPYAAPTANIMAAEEVSEVEGLLSAKAPSAPLAQHLEVIAAYEENQYVLSLESNLNQDELLALASQIKLAPAQ